MSSGIVKIAEEEGAEFIRIQAGQSARLCRPQFRDLGLEGSVACRIRRIKNAAS